MILGVDLGKFAVKGWNGKEKFYIRSKISPSVTHDLLDKESVSVQIDGKTYLFGKQAEEISFNQSKAEELHRIGLYLAIAHYKPTSPVKVFVGCPLSIYKNKPEREEYRNFLLERNDVIIKVNDEEIRFFIEDIKILPETMGAIVSNQTFFADKTVGVIDLGGLNINACIYEEGAALWQHTVTNNLGINILKNQLKEYLNVEYGTSIKDYQMNDIMRYGVNNKPDSIEKIKSFMQSHIDNIKKELQAVNWPVDGSLRIALTGGGTQDLKENFETTFGSVFCSEDSVFDNAKAFYTIGVDVVNG